MNQSSDVRISRISVSHLRESLGIGTARPKLSWQIETNISNWQQTGYEINLFDQAGQLCAETGKVVSSQSVGVEWPFPPLRSRAQYEVQIRVDGTDERASNWSDKIRIETALLDIRDWLAVFITPDWPEDPKQDNPAPYLRKEFLVEDTIESARLYITALGLYEASLNGMIIGDHVLDPGWTLYDKHLRYQTYDVTSQIKPGPNVLGAILGDGWYRGRLGPEGGRRNIWGDKLALLAQLEIRHADGSIQVITSDESWQATTGPILASSLYDGEIYDARLETAGWSLPGSDCAQWHAVVRADHDRTTLSAPLGPPVRRQEKIQAVEISQSPAGKVLLDFGQNLVGRLSIQVRGPAGTVITFRHAEVLEQGELGVRPLRTARATDIYTLKGSGMEVWEPRFTFHGFRYVEVTGWPGDIFPDSIQAVVLHSDLERTGWFSCSDPLVNRLHENVVWGMRGNFIDVPTDCPQRDERLGWTGDLQVFSPTASFLYDVSGFLSSWLFDLEIEQNRSSGRVPPVVPNALGDTFGAAAWGDAATIVPWVLYQRFGDDEILQRQFASMRSWVDAIVSMLDENMLWQTGFQFGDWLDPTAPPNQPWKAQTDKAIVASAYFAHSARIVARTAEILKRTDDRDYYTQMADKATAAFNREYVTPSGRLMSDAQTSYALAIVFDLLPTDRQRAHAGKRLAELVREGDYHIQTGFVGTPLICDALCLTGSYREAYQLLTQTTCPSWLYPVTMGATTIWERWDSMLPDGTINPGEMTSFNHYALGAVADWMHRTIGGLNAIEPGYRRMVFSPRPGGGINQALVRHRTPYGLAECAWQVKDQQFEMSASVPPNTTARVILPGREDAPIEVGAGTYHWQVSYQDPDARGPLTIDHSIGDILSDSTARESLENVLRQNDTPGYIFGMLYHERNVPLRSLIELHPQADSVMSSVIRALESCHQHPS